MKVWLPATVFIFILWVFQVVILPEFLLSQTIPRLILAGIVVLAVAEENLSVPWLIFMTGIWLDVASGLLVGSFALGFLSIYLALHKFQKDLLPTSFRYLAVVGLSILASLVLNIWIVVYSWIGGKFGWPIVVEDYFSLQLNTGLRLFLTGAVAFVLYIFWQELSHRLSKPLSFKR